jgi:hypothetical protein
MKMRCALQRSPSSRPRPSWSPVAAPMAPRRPMPPPRAERSTQLLNRLDARSDRWPFVPHRDTDLQQNHVYRQSGGVWIEPGRDLDR